MDLEKDDGQELQEIVAIQEIQDNQNNQIEILKKNENFNLTFNENQIFQGEADILKNKAVKEENEENEEEEIDQEKKHEDIINDFTLKLNLNPNNPNSSNKIINRPSLGQRDDSEIEGYELIINSMKEKKEDNINNDSINKSNKKKDIKNIEMKLLENNEDKEEKKENKDN